MDLQAIPILLSPDLDQTARFCETLQLTVERPDPAYLIARGHGIELHYSYNTRPEVCTETSCYIRGGDVQRLHPLFTDLGIANLSDFAPKPWGMSEFYIHDPHGNLLKFGMSTDELDKTT